MKISTIIPAFNEEKYIRKCLESLKKQTILPDEIIVVDNNSIDNTVNIAKEFGVKVVSEHKQGMIFTRNRGFEEASFDIISRCDADTVLPSYWIATIKSNFEKRKIDALVGSIVYYDAVLKTPAFGKAYVLGMQKLLGFHTLIGSSMVLTKKIWDTVKKETCKDDSKVHEDIDLAIHIHKNKGVIHYDPTWIAHVSARRIKKRPFSFFGEYPWRVLKTLRNH